MDKDLARLHDATRSKLLTYRDQLKSTLPSSSSTLKNARKALSKLDLNFELYANLLDNLMSEGADFSKMRKELRNFEEKSLDAIKLLEDDTVHHRVQSRTGGDTLAYAKGSDVRSVIQRLKDKYGITFGDSSGPGGNLTADMSLSNFAHKQDTNAKGLELASGIGKNPDRSLTAHRKGLAGYARHLKPSQIASESALFEALDKRVSEQLENAKVGAATDAPRQKAVRDLLGDPLTYSPNATIEDVAKQRKKLLTVDPAKIQETYKELINNRKLLSLQEQTKLIKGLSAASLIPVAGIALDGAEATARGIKASQTKDPADFLQAAISSAETAIGATGVGEALATPLAAINMMIDQHRDGGSKFNGSGNGPGRNGKNNGRVKIGKNNGNGGRSGAKRRKKLAIT